MKKKWQPLLLAFIVLLGLLPGFTGLYFYFEKQEELETMASLIDEKESAFATFLAKEASNIVAMKQYSGADPLYVSKTLGRYPLILCNADKNAYFKESLFAFKREEPISLLELQKILASIEYPKIEERAPQLFTRQLELERIPSLEEQDKFKLNIKFVQREFAS